MPTDNRATAERIAGLRQRIDEGKREGWVILPLTHPAPAPSEAVACTGLTAMWCPACGVCTCERRDLAMDSPACPLHGEGSKHHPAPARGVTEEEREVMGDIALDGFIDWCDLDPTDENRSASALARQYLALRQKSRTPDAEGGA